MAAIVSVTNGVTVENAVHFNQFRDAFSNVLGITDTGQDALGRLVLPKGTSMPSTPSPGMLFYKTDEVINGLDGDSLGTMFLRNPSGVWIPQGGIRQIVSVEASAAIDLTETEVTVVEAEISTSGGALLIIANMYFIGSTENASGTGNPYMVAKLRLDGDIYGSTDIAGHMVHANTDGGDGAFINNAVDRQISFIQSQGLPSDNYTVLLRAYTGFSGTFEWATARTGRYFSAFNGENALIGPTNIVVIELG